MSKIDKPIKEQESENLEFKKNWRDEYLKTLSAFANSKGGRLILGKDDKGNITGKLPEELSIEDLKKEHSSYPRNPLIANVFYLILIYQNNKKLPIS